MELIFQQWFCVRRRVKMSLEVFRYNVFWLAVKPRGSCGTTDCGRAGHQVPGEPPQTADLAKLPFVPADFLQNTTELRKPRLYFL